MRESAGLAQKRGECKRKAKEGVHCIANKTVTVHQRIIGLGGPLAEGEALACDGLRLIFASLSFSINFWLSRERALPVAPQLRSRAWRSCCKASKGSTISKGLLWEVALALVALPTCHAAALLKLNPFDCGT